MSTASPNLTATHSLAHGALTRWAVPPDAALRLINVSENITYLVEADGWRSILRVHRPGYHSHRAIECELAWMAALARESEVATPEVIPGKDAVAIQSFDDGDNDQRHMVMFAFIDGEAPDEACDLTPAFRTLGAMAAATHRHSISWPRPAPFERLTWDETAVFGSAATWGNWRAAPNLTADAAEVLEEVEATVIRRLAGYGKSAERYGLIHADMRLANLIITPRGPRLIDFDDCGFGWFMYDFAAAISFIEDSPQIPAMQAAWVAGYRTIRSLTAEDEAEIPTLIMLRRMALLAWIGSHIDAPEPQALAPDFARVSADLGRVWLKALA